MKEYLIALNAIDGLGPAKIHKLIETFGSPQAVFDAPPELMLSQKIITAASAEQFANKNNLLDNAQKQIDDCAKQNIIIVSPQDDVYPRYLKEIFAPPQILYLRGDPEVLKNHAIAIVGTRNPTQYGLDCTCALTAELCANAVIVSGLARGIDTAAHERCLDASGKTVAVLGCGVDRVYPAENKDLALRILENGAIISEFPPGTRPEPYNFPRRNRVISGVSCGVIVVEAGEKSGALITAKYALEQNRSVFAVPGSITSRMSGGTFKLIKDGAIPIRSAADVFEHISETTFAPLISASPQTIKRELPPPPDLTNEEQVVYNVLTEIAERVDKIAEDCNMEIPALLGVLLSLELKGVVAQVGGQMFKRSYV